MSDAYGLWLFVLVHVIVLGFCHVQCKKDEHEQEHEHE